MEATTNESQSTVLGFNGAEVKRLRLAQGDGVTAFAARIGKSSESLRSYESNRSDPRATDVVAMAIALGVSPGDLFTEMSVADLEASGAAEVVQVVRVRTVPRRRRRLARKAQKAS
jgi:transcriptional regulator with XRE-family HTH domain